MHALIVSKVEHISDWLQFHCDSMDKKKVGMEHQEIRRKYLLKSYMKHE